MPWFNIPLNYDLNHLFFEVMAVGALQVVFGSSMLLGPIQDWARWPDLHRFVDVKGVEVLETLVNRLLADAALLRWPGEPPPELLLHELLRFCLSPPQDRL
jgi:hypothetical protein